LIVFTHPTGNANVRAAAKGLAEAGVLQEFYTAIAAFPGSWIDKLGAIKPFAEVRRRSFDPVLKPMTHMLPLLEAGRLLASKGKITSLTKHETGVLSIDAVYKGIDKSVANKLLKAHKKGAKAVYAYEDGAFASFATAKQLGMQRFYDLPIGYWKAARRLMENELAQWPEWKATFTGFEDSAEKLKRKDDELSMADHIFVASKFTAKTLQDYYSGKLAPIHVVPYGFPVIGEVRYYDDSIAKRPLKLLFVGGLSQRKGLANLFAAIEHLTKEVQLTVVGRKIGGNCPALDAALEKHNYIPSLEHAEILKLMRKHDVLVFPSLFEGFGLVITEAMSQGTPVITTDRTAGPDLISHGENGWLIEAGSTASLRAMIENLISQPEAVVNAGIKARETAMHRSWDEYGMELALEVAKYI
jgi:glycosyltransferase involved in cell wall biosynthesis